MDRRLIVMRHAKSSWSDPAATDHERPLNKRGRQDAPKVAAQLVQMEWQPQWVLSSDSQRTRETMARMQLTLSGDLPVHFRRALYHSGVAAVRQEVVTVPDDVQTLMVLGHNPGWEEVIYVLCGEDVVLKTANAALLEGEGSSWPEALRGHGTWRLHQVLRSREL